jgi:hypothetical protein
LAGLGLCLLTSASSLAATIIQSGNSTSLETGSQTRLEEQPDRQGQPENFYREPGTGAFIMRTNPSPSFPPGLKGSLYNPYGSDIYVTPEIYVVPPFSGYIPRPPHQFGGRGPNWNPGKPDDHRPWIRQDKTPATFQPGKTPGFKPGFEPDRRAGQGNRQGMGQQPKTSPEMRQVPGGFLP